MSAKSTAAERLGAVLLGLVAAVCLLATVARRCSEPAPAPEPAAVVAADTVSVKPVKKPRKGAKKPRRQAPAPRPFDEPF